MNVRLENLHAESQSNYVSFLDQSRQPKGRRGSDHASIHSVSSMRSVMSGMSSLWSNFGISAASSAAKAEKQIAATQADLKYLYSAFTKIPCLRLAPDRRARLIQGYEEFPFDTAVPLYAFKNVSALEISDIDVRQFFGWDRMADQLRTLTVKRASVDDPADLLINIVLDDMDKRRRRSSKAQMSPISTWNPSTSPKRSPTIQQAELVHSTHSDPGSPEAESQLEEQRMKMRRSGSVDLTVMAKNSRPRSNSPVRPTSSRTGSAYGHSRGSYKVHRSGSGSSSNSDTWYHSRTGSSSNLLSMNGLPASKWRFLKHLSLADNSLTSISVTSLAPLANTLNSFDLSTNLFNEIPDCLASLTALRALNLSNCMISSLHSLLRNPLPAISALNLRSNRLQSLAGVERLFPLERLDLRDNNLTDPMELARLTGLPELREIWVAGNPLTRTHSNYRVTIFNLFRRTPGYTEDILIDGSGPGYRERQQLVDRVPEKANVPVMKPMPAAESSPVVAAKISPVIVQEEPKEPAILSKERPASTPVGKEVYSHSTRRKKASKRRIVDLSTSDSSPIRTSPGATPNSGKKMTGATSGSDSNYGVSPDLSKPPPPAFNLSAAQLHGNPPLSKVDEHSGNGRPVLPTYSASEADLPTIENQDWNVSGELYRKKVEALRNEMGNGWLSVLSEESWDGQKKIPGEDNFLSSPAGPLGRPNAITTRANSQQAIYSGRTLG